MAEDLLSSQDWADFGDAIGSLKETFFNIDVTIKKKQRNYSSWIKEVKESETSNTDITIKGLVVFGSSGKGDQNDRDQQGQLIISDGYILFTWDSLLSANLIDLVNKKVNINSALDEVYFNGQLYKLVKDDMIGPFEDRFALLKLRFTKIISD